MIRVVNVEKDDEDVDAAFDGDVGRMMNHNSLGITLPSRRLCGDVEEVSKRLCLDPSPWEEYMV
jgi:hypothetical protein